MRWLRGIIVGLVVLFGASTPSDAASIAVDGLSDLGDQRVSHPPYVSQHGDAGPATSGSVGDLDGDELEDTALMLSTSDPDYRSALWVTMASQDLPVTIAAEQPGWRGFKVAGDDLGSSFAGIDDLDGDGIGEVALYDWRSKRIVVAFGHTDGRVVDIESLEPSEGFEITDVQLNGGGGGGTIFYGSTYDNQGIAAMDDQNGDGRQDLAFCDGEGVTVLYSPPRPAGKSIDADEIGDHGYRIETGSHPFYGNTPRPIADLNDDGIEDLVVFHSGPDEDSAHAVGVNSPPAGSIIDAALVAERGQGFELWTDATKMNNGITIGDQNGDGVTDLGLIGYENTWTASVLYTPETGTKRKIWPTPPELGSGEIEVGGSSVIDVGDQDDDGISDLAIYDTSILLSSTGRIASLSSNPTGLDDLGGQIIFFGRLIVDTVEDRNGDGRREIVTAHARPFSDSEGPPFTATWHNDIYSSAIRPIAEDLPDLPEQLPDGDLRFSSRFKTSEDGAHRNLAGRPALVTIDEAGRERFTAAPEVIDANQRSTEVSLEVDPSELGLRQGSRFRYRLLLENNRGFVGSTAIREATLAADGPTGGGGTSGEGSVEPPPPGPECRRTKLKGTKKRDRIRGGAGCQKIVGKRGADRLRGGSGDDLIVGGRGRDRLRGGSGADRLIGGRGRDRLRGGAGADRLIGGRGRDQLRCGRGEDVAITKGRDKARGCETVIRR